MNKIINIIALLIATFSLIIEYLPNICIEIEFEVLMLLLPGLMIFINMLYQLKKTNTIEEKENIKKISFSYLFYVYILAIISLVFLNNSYRSLYIAKNHNLSLFSQENIEKNTSLIPFKFMIDMFNKYSIDVISLKTVIYNMVGNILLFAPMGIFIPILFKSKIKSIKSYVILMLIIIVSIELIQFFLKIGQADIDDFILNMFGATLSYIIYTKKHL